MAQRIIFPLILAIALLGGNLWAEVTAKLPGNNWETKDALNMSNVVLVGKVAKNGSGSPFFNTGGRYSTIRGLQVEVLRLLRGSCPGQLSLDVDVANDEKIPKAGETYIFFVTSIAINKLLPATDANIAVVKKLIAQLPAK